MQGEGVDRQRVDLTIEWPLPEHAGSLPELEISAHGTTLAAVPCRLTIGGESFLSTPLSLPFETASCDVVTCIDVLEFVRDDEALIEEISRILRPGGMLVLHTVKSGPLGALDSVNLYRYLRDISKRGIRPSELAESGWRRHYGRAEITGLLADNGIVVRSVRTSGLGLTELADLGAMVGFRWISRNEEAYLQARRTIAGLRRRERLVKFRHGGFWIDLVGHRV